MHRLDMEAMTKYGLHGDLLMENAGHAVYFVISQDLGVPGRRFAVISGPGNNGGDGFVVARKLHAGGGRVRVLVMGKPKSFSGPARRNLERLDRAGVEVVVRPDSSDIVEALGWCDAVVDGILGTGISRDLSRGFREAVEEINRIGKPVFSIDIPSGVDGDTGQLRGAAVHASTTVTFGLPKQGNFLQPGGGLGGRLILSHISFPPALLDKGEVGVTLNVPSAPPERGRSCGEASPGTVFFLFQGAASGRTLGSSSHGLRDRDPDPGSVLAAITFAVVRGRPASVVAPSLLLPSGIDEGRKGAGAALRRCSEPGFQENLAADLSPLADPNSLLVLAEGPDGSGTYRQLAHELLARARASVLMGTKAFSLLPFRAAELRRRQGNTAMILDREDLARLSGKEPSEVLRDPLRLLRNWAQELGLIAVLTEDPCLIALPDRRMFIHPRGSCGRTIPGGEALLLGTVAALYDHGLSLEEAVRNGVVLFSAARDGFGGQGGEELDSEEEFRGREGEEWNSDDAIRALSETARRYLREYAAFRDGLPAPIALI